MVLIAILASGLLFWSFILMVKSAVEEHEPKVYRIQRGLAAVLVFIAILTLVVYCT